MVEHFLQDGVSQLRGNRAKREAPHPERQTAEPLYLISTNLRGEVKELHEEEQGGAGNLVAGVQAEDK